MVKCWENSLSWFTVCGQTDNWTTQQYVHCSFGPFCPRLICWNLFKKRPCGKLKSTVYRISASWHFWNLLRFQLWLNQDAAEFTFKYSLVKWSLLSAFTFCSHCSAEYVSLTASVRKEVSVLYFSFYSIFNIVTFLKDVTKHGNKSPMTDRSEKHWKMTALEWQRSRHNSSWDCTVDL